MDGCAHDEMLSMEDEPGNDELCACEQQSLMLFVRIETHSAYGRCCSVTGHCACCGSAMHDKQAMDLVHWPSSVH